MEKSSTDATSSRDSVVSGLSSRVLGGSTSTVHGLIQESVVARMYGRRAANIGTVINATHAVRILWRRA